MFPSHEARGSGPCPLKRTLTTQGWDCMEDLQVEVRLGRQGINSSALVTGATSWLILLYLCFSRANNSNRICIIFSFLISNFLCVCVSLREVMALGTMSGPWI